jgi:hypothetical protein
MHSALVNRAPALLIFSCHEKACSFFHCLEPLILGLLACAHALRLHCRPLISLPSVDPIGAVVPYCTGTIAESVVPDSVIVSKVTIVLAAAKRKASIVSAIQTATIATA